MTAHDGPAELAHAVIARVLALLGECRTAQGQLGAPSEPAESASAQAERELYGTLLAALEQGLVRMIEDTLRVLQQASRPLGPRGAEWLAQQERRLEQGRRE